MSGALTFNITVISDLQVMACLTRAFKVMGSSTFMTLEKHHLADFVMGDWPSIVVMLTGYESAAMLDIVDMRASLEAGTPIAVPFSKLLTQAIRSRALEIPIG